MSHSPKISNLRLYYSIKLLIKSKVSKVYIAGFDGYSLDSYEDYEDKEMTLGKAKDKIGNLNENLVQG